MRTSGDAHAHRIGLVSIRTSDRKYRLALATGLCSQAQAQPSCGAAVSDNVQALVKPPPRAPSSAAAPWRAEEVGACRESRAQHLHSWQAELRRPKGGAL